MTVEYSPSLLRVGVILPTKKWLKHGFVDCLRIQFIRLDPFQVTAQSLDADHISLIVHKIVDLLLPDEELTRLSTELSKWGGHIIDDFSRVQLLCDRKVICKLLQHIPGPISLPPTGECRTDTILTFPLIRKPVVACSTENSHLMCLFPQGSKAHLKTSTDHILQVFIPHGGILYKCYVIGSELRIQLRPSLITPETKESEPRPFDSQSMKRSGFLPPGEEHITAWNRLQPHMTSIKELTNLLRHRLGLTLFGWDLIIEEGTERPYIIDVNYYPGYDEVDFLNLLCDYLICNFGKQKV